MVVLKNEVQVDIRLSTPEAYGALIQYNTGSKQHNILLRTYALEKGLSLSEYGIKEKETDKTLEFADEKSFYKKLGLPYIPPEIRQGTDEIEKALAGKLPKLVELENIKGDIHTHTVASADAVGELEDMVDAAADLDYEYYGVSDHPPSIQARGFYKVEKMVTEMREHVDKANKERDDIEVLCGYEVLISADAKLQLPDELLKILDYGIGSIHTAFDQSKEEITKRLLVAIESPYIHVIGHPTGRLINQRDPVDPDWDKVFDAVKANDKVLEINSQPSRLDLTFDLVREAVERDIKLVINTDSHAVDQLMYMRYGIDVARRGWAEAKNIINTLPYKEFVKALGIK
jgi:DNA polymerase (family 10)